MDLKYTFTLDHIAVAHYRNLDWTVNHSLTGYLGGRIRRVGGTALNSLLSSPGGAEAEGDGRG